MNKIKCYCGHTTTCECVPLEQQPLSEEGKTAEETRESFCEITPNLEKCMNCAKQFDINQAGCLCPDCYLSTPNKGLTAEQFCKIASAYEGETIDSLKQIVNAKFDGQELFDFVNHVLKSPVLHQREKEQKEGLTAEEVLPLLLDCRNILRQCESISIGKTQINVKIIQINEMIKKLSPPPQEVQQSPTEQKGARHE